MTQVKNMASGNLVLSKEKQRYPHIAYRKGEKLLHIQGLLKFPRVRTTEWCSVGQLQQVVSPPNRPRLWSLNWICAFLHPLDHACTCHKIEIKISIPDLAFVLDLYKTDAKSIWFLLTGCALSHPVLTINQMHLICAPGSNHTYDRQYKCISKTISWWKRVLKYFIACPEVLILRKKWTSLTSSETSTSRADNWKTYA
jgi:hypothetical protein